MPSAAIRYEGANLYPKQKAAIYDPARISIIAASTKSGKTQGCLAWILDMALHLDEGQNAWWVAPVFGQAEIAFRRMHKQLRPIRQLCKTNQSTMTIVLPNGARLVFKSGERSDDLYGEDVYACVIDEGSRVREESWHAIRTTLTATKGPVRIIGNVKGKKNWFYQLGKLAEDGAAGMAFHKLTCWDAVEAGVLDREEIESSRRDFERLGRLGAWNQLYMAEVAGDGANPFGLDAVYACTVNADGSPVGFSNERPAVAGVDLAGRGAQNVNPAAETHDRDYAAIALLDKHGHMTLLRQFRKDPIAVADEIVRVVGKTPALIDATGQGDETVLRLQRRGDMRVEGFIYKDVARQELLEGLALAIGEGAIKFPDEQVGEEGAPTLVEQLEAFEYDFTGRGERWVVPRGYHDDGVMALALAVKKLPWKRKHNVRPLPIEKPDGSLWASDNGESAAWKSYTNSKPTVSKPAEAEKRSLPAPVVVSSASRWSGGG